MPGSSLSSIALLNSVSLRRRVLASLARFLFRSTEGGNEAMTTIDCGLSRRNIRSVLCSSIEKMTAC